jgi:hypothetical protein
MAIGLAFPIEFFCKFLGYGAGSWHALLVILFLSAALMKKTGHAGKRLLPLGLALLLIGLNSQHFAGAFGILTGKIQAGRGAEYGEVRTLVPTPAHPLLLDISVARYVFDYRIPAGSVDFWYSSPFPKFGFAAAYRPQDIYLLGPDLYDLTIKSTNLEGQSPPKWSIFKWSFYQNPCNVFMVRAEDCKGLK